MTDDDPTELSRRAADRAELFDRAELSDRTELSGRTRPSRRRIAEHDTQPAPTEPAAPPTAADAKAEPEGARGGAGVLRPPPDVVAPPSRVGEFGEQPHHYFPRLRHSQEASPVGVWPSPDLSPRPSSGGIDVQDPALLDPEARRVRDAAARRRRAWRIVAAVGGTLVAIGAAAAIIVLAL